MSGKKRFLVLTLSIIFLVSACSRPATQSPPSSAGIQILEPAFTPSGPELTEAEVPRVSVEQAKAALEAGTAVIVDVRAPPAFTSRHISGAINIPLSEIELNPANLPLDKDQWIITYCT